MFFLWSSNMINNLILYLATFCMYGLWFFMSAAKFANIISQNVTTSQNIKQCCWGKFIYYYIFTLFLASIYPVIEQGISPDLWNHSSTRRALKLVNF